VLLAIFALLANIQKVCKLLIEVSANAKLLITDKLKENGNVKKFLLVFQYPNVNGNFSTKFTEWLSTLIVVSQ